MGRKKKIRTETEWNGHPNHEGKGKPLDAASRNTEGLASSEPRSETPANPVDDKAVDSLALGAASEDSAGSFMDPVKKRKQYKKRAPKGEDKPPVDPAKQLEETKTWVRPLVSLASDMGVRIAEDSSAGMTPTESEVITDSLAGCIQLYLPDILGKHACLIVLLTFSAQYSARVYALRRANLNRLIELRKRGVVAANAEVRSQPGLSQ